MPSTEDVKPTEGSPERIAIIPPSPDAFKAKLEAIADRPDTTHLEIENEVKEASADVATFGSRVGYGEVELARAEADLTLELEPLKTAAEQRAAAVFAETTAEASEVPLSTPTPSVDTTPAMTLDAAYARPTSIDVSAPEPIDQTLLSPVLAIPTTPDAAMVVPNVAPAPLAADATYKGPDALDVSAPDASHMVPAHPEMAHGPLTEAETQAMFEAGPWKRILESPERAGAMGAVEYAEYMGDKEIAENQKQIDTLLTAPESVRDAKYQNQLDALEYSNGIARKQKLIVKEQVEAEFLNREKARLDEQIATATKEIEPLLTVGPMLTPAQAERFEVLRSTLTSLGAELQEVSHRLVQKKELILNLQDTATSLERLRLKTLGILPGSEKVVSGTPSVSADKQMGASASSSALEGGITAHGLVQAGISLAAKPLEKWLAFTIDPKASSDATIKAISELPKTLGDAWDEFLKLRKNGKSGTAQAGH